MTVTRTVCRRALAALLASLLAACGSLGDVADVHVPRVTGEPPRNDGTPVPESFAAFVENFWPTAEAAGVSRSTYDAAFRDIGPDQDVLDKARNQAEFAKPIWEYLDGAVSDSRVATGRQMLATYAADLDRIEARYGVQRQVVLAVWGMESSFGAVLENPRVVKNAVRALATLAWGGGKRAKYGRQQLLAVLKILQRGDTDPRHVTGSWAGAMGHTQFIPTTYLAYAVDYDGDGRRDIWRTIPDALASTANYLAKAGWRSGNAWGYEVILPAGFDTRRAGARMTLREWGTLGLVRADGSAFPRPDDVGALFMPAGAGGPAFLTLHNFQVIKRYNAANAYALGVGLLSDRIAGGGPVVGKWPWTYEPLTEPEKQEMQRLLAARGYDVGGADGRIGTATLEAVKAYQAAVGLPVDGNPSKAVLLKLREGA